MHSLGNNSYANDPQCNVLTLSVFLWFNRDTKKERDRERKKKVMRKGVVRVTFIWGGGRRKGRALLVFSHATPARPTGSSMKVKIYETEEV